MVSDKVRASEYGPCFWCGTRLLRTHKTLAGTLCQLFLVCARALCHLLLYRPQLGFSPVPRTFTHAFNLTRFRLDIGAIPVAENGKLGGMVTDRDITIRCVAEGADMSKVTAKDVMTRGVVYCRDNEDVEDAVRIMEGKQIRRLPVLDEAMQMVGMVSLGDVSHALPRDITGEVTKAVSAHHR